MRWLWPAFLVSCFAAVSWGKSLAATSETERRDSYLIAREVILKVRSAENEYKASVWFVFKANLAMNAMKLLYQRSIIPMRRKTLVHLYGINLHFEVISPGSNCKIFVYNLLTVMPIPVRSF